MAPKKTKKKASTGKAANTGDAATENEQQTRPTRSTRSTRATTAAQTTMSGRVSKTSAPKKATPRKPAPKRTTPKKRVGSGRTVGKEPAARQMAFDAEGFKARVKKFREDIDNGRLETISVNPILEELLIGVDEILKARPEPEALDITISQLQLVLDIINDALMSRTTAPNPEKFDGTFPETLRERIGSLKDLRDRQVASSTLPKPMDWCKVRRVKPYVLAGNSRVAPYSGEVWWADRPPYFLDGENPFFIEVTSNRIKQDLMRGHREKQAAGGKKGAGIFGRRSASKPAPETPDIEADNFWTARAKDWKLAEAHPTVLEFAKDCYAEAVKGANDFALMRSQQRLHEAEKQKELQAIAPRRG